MDQANPLQQKEVGEPDSFQGKRHGTERRHPGRPFPCLIFMLLSVFVFVLFDITGDGMVSLAQNRRLQHLFETAQLTGKTEADVVAALGRPPYSYGVSRNVKCLNYAPYFGVVPYNKFQVVIENGICTGYEMMDD